MIFVEVSINEERICSLNFDKASLINIISSIRKNTEKEIISISVIEGVFSHKTEDRHNIKTWLDQKLKVGDVISIKTSNEK
jgi:hypothetical protein